MNTDRITYAVGDVFGMAALLSSLLRAIERDAEKMQRGLCVVFLGNLIDLGTHSNQVLDAVIQTLENHPESVLLASRRDKCLMEFLEGDFSNERFDFWMYTGGRETIASFGLPPKADFDRIRRHILQKSPGVLKLLRSAKRQVVAGDYCFVHGGIDPGKPLSQQTSEDVVVSRHDFLRFNGQFEKIIVHGHAPTKNFLPEVHSNRIALNVSAFRSGRVAALAVAPEEEPRILIAGRVGNTGTATSIYSARQYYVKYANREGPITDRSTSYLSGSQTL